MSKSWWCLRGRRNMRPVTGGAAGTSTHAKFLPSLEIHFGHSLKRLDIVKKIWAILTKLFAPLISQACYGPAKYLIYKIFVVWFFDGKGFLLIDSCCFLFICFFVNIQFLQIEFKSIVFSIHQFVLIPAVFNIVLITPNFLGDNRSTFLYTYACSFYP